jgi:CHAT domain-containing protein
MTLLKSVTLIATLLLSYLPMQVSASAKNDLLPNRLIILKYEMNGTNLNIEVLRSDQRTNKSMSFDIKQTELDMEAAKYLLNKSDPDDKDSYKLHELLRRFYRIFLGPIEKTLSGNCLICLIPGKIFSSYPFHLFMKNNKYLLEDHYVFYAIETEQVYDSLSKQPLKYAEINGSDFDKFSDELGARISKSLTILDVASISERASPEQFEEALRHSKIIYLTTHGSYDFTHDTYRLSFSKYIHIYKNFSLRLGSTSVDVHSLRGTSYRTKFLFANACESASQINFPKKAYRLGIDTFMGSLWSHPSMDRASANVVRRFFRNWRSGMGKVEALISAQRETLKREREVKNSMNDGYRRNGDYPHFWAQFILYGDWR